MGARQLRTRLRRACIVVVACMWAATGVLKLASPSETLPALAGEIGISAGLVVAAYYTVSVLELLIGVCLLTTRTHLPAAKASFLLASVFAAGYLLAEPLRNRCPCTGAAIDLGGPGRLALVCSILLLSFWFMWAVTPAKAGTGPKRGVRERERRSPTSSSTRRRSRM